MIPTKVASVSEQFPDRQALAAQGSANRVTRVVNGIPFKTSYVSPPLVFAGGDQKTFYHGLGRTPARWCVEDATGGPPAVYRVSWDAQKVVLAATLATTVTVRVAVD